MKYLVPVLLILSLSQSVFSKSNPEANFSGRFKLLQLSDNRHDQYILDSDTGRIWKHFCTSALDRTKPIIDMCELGYWEELEKIDLPEKVVDKPKKSK